MITGNRRVEDREIKTTIFNILINNEAIGYKTIDYTLLIQLCRERLEDQKLNYTLERIVSVIEEMKKSDLLYTVTTISGDKLGLTR